MQKVIYYKINKHNQINLLQLFIVIYKTKSDKYAKTRREQKNEFHKNSNLNKIQSIIPFR